MGTMRTHRAARTPRAHTRGAKEHEVVPFASGEPPAPDPVPTDALIVGLTAVVTIRIPGGAVPGEVRLYVRGTYEQLIAYAPEPLEVGRHVRVRASRGHRAADVDYLTPGE
jgi:hypothetical protein